MRSIQRIGFWILCSSVFLFVACSEEKEKEEEGLEVEDRTETEKDTLDEPKAFVLPTPTQVPTLLYNVSAKYDPKKLLPAKKLPSAPQKKKKALQLGGLLIDAAYSGINEDQGRVEQYARSMRKLCQKLYLGRLIEKKRIEKLEELADQKKGLNKELLSFYRDVQKELRKEDEKQLGYYVVKGAFIEGLYLTATVGKNKMAGTHSRLMEQQKVYFENLSKLRGILFPNKSKEAELWSRLEKKLEREEGFELKPEEIEEVRKEAFL